MTESTAPCAGELGQLDLEALVQNIGRPKHDVAQVPVHGQHPLADRIKY